MLGHFTLAIPLEETFILGLAFVAIGTGLLKPNISSIVGQLYADHDERRDSGFTIFYMSINIGSMLGFAVCGYLGERIGWHWGFGAAGIGMLFGVIQFVYFRSQLGTAGLNPNEMAEGRRSTLRLWTIITVLFFAAVVISGVLGFGALIQYFLLNVFVTFWLSFRLSILATCFSLQALQALKRKTS
jgi:POT family proton-dependent oligopeptide transporter